MRYDVKQYNTIIIQRTVKISQYNTTQTNTIQTYSAIQRQCLFKLENSEYTKKTIKCTGINISLFNYKNTLYIW